MQGIIIDGIAIAIACLAIAVAAIGLIVYRPWKRRHRHRRRHSNRPRIDLFEGHAAESVSDRDA
jgi:uncharacterized iron-regulated membrane protein